MQSLEFDPQTWALIEQAARSGGVSPQEWLRALVVDHLQGTGALPVEPADSLRPEELNANNDG